MSYRTSHSQPGIGHAYDATLGRGHLFNVWTEVEEPLLEQTLKELRARGGESILDFACGTGRITQVNERLFPVSYGVDISGEMLSRARQRCTRTRFHLADLTSDRPEQLPPVDVITAFRFFLNAEDDLRSQVLVAFRGLLRPSGHIVLNVQWNTQSISGALYRLRGFVQRRSVATASFGDVEKCLSASGFVVEGWRGYGALPYFGSHFDYSSARLVRWAERAANRFPALSRRSQYFIVIARRSTSASIES